MTDQRIIEERLENIAQMLDSTTGFLENVDIFIPKPAKKMIYSMLKSEVINSIVEDIQRRRPPRMVLIGRSGVGKSSLINAMFGSYLAVTSSVEVGTVEHEMFQYTKDGKVLFEVIDTRGLKENIQDGVDSAEASMQKVIEAVKPDAFLLLTSGADRSTLKEDAEEMFALTRRLKSKTPIITVVTRVDELEPARMKDATQYSAQKKAHIEQKKQQVQKVLKHAGLKHSIVVPVSSYIEWSNENPQHLSEEERERLTIAFDGRYNIDTLLEVIEENVAFNVALDVMINAEIDKAVEKIAETFVKRFSAASGLVGASPIPVADVFILLPIQMVEVSLIAYLSGNKIDGKAAREFITSLGAVFIFGFSLRFVAQQGSKMLNVIPGAGSAISGTVAYTGTYSIGKAAIAYYIKGKSLKEAKQEAVDAKKSLSSDEKQGHSGEAYEQHEVTTNGKYVKKKKSKKTLKKSLQQLTTTIFRKKEK